MTIGPEPRIRIELMSVRLGISLLVCAWERQAGVSSGALPAGKRSHRDNKGIKPGQGIVRSGRGLRVVLDRESVQGRRSQALDAAVVEVGFHDLDLCREGVRGDGKAVVVAGDGHAARRE